MTLFLLAVGLQVGGGIAALIFGKSARHASILAAGGVLGGAALGSVFALGVLLGGDTPALDLPWPVPYGRFALAADPLSAAFLLPAFLVPAAAAVYGAGYLRHATRWLGPHWFFFNLLAAATALVLVATNGVFFLVAWEVMSLAAYFLVVFEHERLEVRKAGWLYLVATHIGTAFLLAFFLLLGTDRGAMDFSTAAPGSAALFLLALVGFGTKAGLVPLHVWLPEAHPAAPSHVSAVLSGVMIKTGVYGILRAVLVVHPAAWWGPVLIVVGLVTGLVGAVFALSQADLKRLLAYSSVENVGVMVTAIGLGLWGVGAGAETVAVLGFGAAIFHALNHALFKGLLFLAAGAVREAVGSLDLDSLGGLLKRMPTTGACFLIGAAAISALPPLNGFASELLLYGAGLAAVGGAPLARAWPGVAAVAGLAFIGGLALVAFVKAAGTAFLGSPRKPAARDAREAPALMRVPMLVLAGACVVLGVLPAAGYALVAPAVEQLIGGGAAAFGVPGPEALLWRTTEGALVLLTLAAAALWLRSRLLAGRDVREADTWACGYAGRVPRGQYTGSSLVEPLASLLAPVLPVRKLTVEPPRGLFPREAWVRTGSADVFHQRLYAPLFAWLRTLLGRARVLQHGHLQWYLLYIFATLLALLLLEFVLRR